MATFPGSVASFPTRVDGVDTNAAADVNNLGSEVTAVESSLLNGLQFNLLPDADNTRNLGSSGKTYANVYAKAITLNGTAVSITVDNAVCDVRLTLTSGTPVTTSDVTAATNVFITPYRGNRIALYDGSTAWNVRTFTELTQALGTLTSALPYDVFAFDNSGTVATELLAWTSTSARATALVLQDGVLVKSGATTRRYLGTFYTTSTTTTEDSLLKRYLWNYYNRVDRPMLRIESTANWAYTTATVRQANGSAANQLEFVIGVAEDAVSATVEVAVSNSSGGVNVLTGIGEDVTNATSTSQIGGQTSGTTLASPLVATLTKIPSVGRHFWAWVEFSTATGTTTWYSTIFSVGLSGISGRVRG